MAVSSAFDAIFSLLSPENPTVPPQNSVPNQCNGIIIRPHHSHSSHNQQIPVQQLLQDQRTATTNAVSTSKPTTSAPNPNSNPEKKQSSRKRPHPERHEISEFDRQPSPSKPKTRIEPPPRPPMKPLSDKCKKFSIDYIVYGRLPL